ncbi:MAG TPA: GNAT family N-acetyltransferase [Thermomicrobiales bacterium]|nr:GNAT family N-acetyltransferase [Thermomicrobiales bacterium]
MGLTARPYRDEDDYARMRALLIETFAVSGPPDYCGLGDLDWWRYTGGDAPDAAPPAHLWFAGDALAGFAWTGGDQVDLVVRPRHHTTETLAAMLAWAEDERRARGGDGDEPPSLTAWAFTRDQTMIAALRGRGYERTDEALCYNFREIGDVPPVTLPAGYTLRHVRGEEDVEARVAVHRDAFAPSRMTAAKHRAVMGAPTYRPDLDLVVVAPDGAFAAYCIVWYDEANRHGLFEPVGCHSAYRRRGLGKAVVTEGLRRLAALDARTATVNSHHDAVPASRLYQSAGFRPLDLTYAWKKRL